MVVVVVTVDVINACFFFVPIFLFTIRIFFTDLFTLTMCNLCTNRNTRHRVLKRNYRAYQVTNTLFSLLFLFFSRSIYLTTPSKNKINFYSRKEHWRNEQEMLIFEWQRHRLELFVQMHNIFSRICSCWLHVRCLRLSFDSHARTRICMATRWNMLNFNAY